MKNKVSKIMLLVLGVSTLTSCFRITVNKPVSSSSIDVPSVVTSTIENVTTSTPTSVATSSKVSNNQTSKPTSIKESSKVATTSAPSSVIQTSEVVTSAPTSAPTSTPTSNAISTNTTANVTSAPTSNVTSANTTANVTSAPTSNVTSANTTANVTSAPTSSVSSANTTANVTSAPSSPNTSENVGSSEIIPSIDDDEYTRAKTEYFKSVIGNEGYGLCFDAQTSYKKGEQSSLDVYLIDAEDVGAITVQFWMGTTIDLGTQWDIDIVGHIKSNIDIDYSVLVSEFDNFDNTYWYRLSISIPRIDENFIEGVSRIPTGKIASIIFVIPEDVPDTTISFYGDFDYINDYLHEGSNQLEEINFEDTTTIEDVPLE